MQKQQELIMSRKQKNKTKVIEVVQEEREVGEVVPRGTLERVLTYIHCFQTLPESTEESDFAYAYLMGLTYMQDVMKGINLYMQNIVADSDREALEMTDFAYTDEAQSGIELRVLDRNGARWYVYNWPKNRTQEWKYFWERTLAQIKQRMIPA